MTDAQRKLPPGSPWAAYAHLIPTGPPLHINRRRVTDPPPGQARPDPVPGAPKTVPGRDDKP